MDIQELDISTLNGKKISVFSAILERRKIGYVIRNFFNQDDVNQIKKSFLEYPKTSFKPFESYTALPRPFDQIAQNGKSDYDEEISYLSTYPALTDIRKTFTDNLKKIAGNIELILSSSEQSLTHSKAWASIRALAVNKGSFELHCGNLFINWNERFFEQQAKHFKIDTHLAFFIMIQKPDTETDIIIYDAHWDEVKEKVDPNTLKNIHNETLPIDKIPSFRVNLQPGDLIIFDESNYWHMVPPFGGTQPRITFGGFISKFVNENKLMFWA